MFSASCFSSVAVEHHRGGKPRDRLGGFARNDAGAPLRDRQRDLGRDVAFEQIVVGEHRPHLGRAEHVLEYVAVENGRRHVTPCR